MGSAAAPKIAVQDARFFLRNVRTRMPFRYGSACLTAVPILHAVVEIESGGERAHGVSADILPPRWFDKDPAHDFARNVSDLLASATSAGRAYQEAASPLTAFDLWWACHQHLMSVADAEGWNGLTASFGSALLERAVMDALGNLTRLPLFELLRHNLLGIDASVVHQELDADAVARALPRRPLGEIWARHTVGLADPIRTADIPGEERLGDGLPQSLEECIAFYGLRYFKLKVMGDPDADWERLSRIAEVLHAICEAYHVSLDGNEQYKSAEGLLALLRWMDEGNEAMRRLRASVLYIEQPLERSAALEPDVAEAVRALSAAAPIVIDESDDGVGAFARATDRGYAGTSVKNCKGVTKGLLNLALAQYLNAVRRPARRFLLTVEDLMNLPVVPLQQDLATAAALGVGHVERNGHHYVRGLDHLSPRERAQCLQRHPRLYVPFGDSARLNVRGGRLDVSSLQVPGYALGVEVDLDSMTPLEEWRFESLG